jgi:S1-C subfamily serine protease
MLRRFTAVMDYAHQQMILDRNSEFRDEDREDMSGISIIAGGSNLKKFIVTQVRPGTPGTDAGIQKGDVIAGVDDDPAADLTLADLRYLFRQLGHPYKLLIEREGKTVVVTMKLRRLL